MLLNNAVAGAEAQAGSFADRLGGVERFENALWLFQARTRIGELHNKLCPGSMKGDVKRSTAGFLERINRVRNQLKKHMQKLIRISANLRIPFSLRKIDAELGNFGDAT